MESIEIYCELDWGAPWYSAHHCVEIITGATAYIEGDRYHILASRDWCN